nr:hypothetical protein [Tanacetum cinerariifolium]
MLISMIYDLIGEIIPCSDLSSRNVPALSAKCPGPLVVGSNMPAFTVTGQMANPFVVSALGSTRPIMVIVAFRAQRFRSSVRFLLARPSSANGCLFLLGISGGDDGSSGLMEM